MVWGVGRTYRRVAAALALFGVAFYALLLPWHLTSQLAAGLFEARFGPLAGVMCRTSPDGAANPGLPGAPATSCPICKGLAAFQVTLASEPQVILPPALRKSQFGLAAHDDAAGAAVPTPRNRGPPLPA